MLVDLEELLLQCRDVRARAYMAESISSYKSGAYRSSIVSSWIAVCYDILGKLHELELSGDKEAEKLVHEIEVARQSNDIKKLLEFEHNLLTVSKDKFELLSDIEYSDLLRLVEDRNRCAHPTLMADGTAYSPSAELARTHIRNAVDHLLKHPPIQGKQALDRILSDIDSRYFPTKRVEVKSVMASGMFSNPRESLIRNLIVVLLKSVLLEQPDSGSNIRRLAALFAISDLHRSAFERVISANLQRIASRVSDNGMHRVASLLIEFNYFWDYFDQDMKSKLENYTRLLPYPELSLILDLYDIPQLSEYARIRIRTADSARLRDALLFSEPNSEVLDNYIENLASIRGYTVGIEWCKEISQHSSKLSLEQVKQIIIAAARNNSIKRCFEFPNLLRSIERSSSVNLEVLNQLLTESNLPPIEPITTVEG